MNYSKIEEQIKSQNVDMEVFFKDIDMSRAGYYRMMKEKTLKVDVLEKIASALKQPISFFFDEPEAGPKMSAEDLRNKVDELYEENRELLKENKQLLQRISVLEKNSTISGDVEFTKLKGK